MFMLIIRLWVADVLLTQQVELLSHSPHILVATPGRLLDLADSGHLKLTPPSGTARTSQLSGAGEGHAGAQGVQVCVFLATLCCNRSPQDRLMSHIKCSTASWWRRTCEDVGVA
jgi:hypothetical protein